MEICTSITGVPIEYAPIPADAIAQLAFGMHFLTDAFAGGFLDLRKLAAPVVDHLHALKTGRLISASVCVITILEAAGESETMIYRRFADELARVVPVVEALALQSPTPISAAVALSSATARMALPVLVRWT